MARRASRQGAGGWWVAAMLIAGALALGWWMSARRAETPALPSSIPGARTLKEAPGAPSDPRAQAGEEITQPEKEELERVLRERGAPGRQ